MAETSFPFDTVDTTETAFSQFFRRLNATGVWAHPDTLELQVAADTGLGVNITAGTALVRGHFYINDGTLPLTLSAGEAQPRIDIIVLRLDPTANSIVAAILAGTAAASPVAPALTQTDSGVYETPLAHIAVAASAATITTGNITDKRRYMAFPVGLWSTSLRPTAPRLGQQGFNTDLGYSEEWNGSTWRPAGKPTLVDADTLLGRKWYFGTTDPGSSFGAVGDIYFKHEA